jgi:hypothetical protein
MSIEGFDKSKRPEQIGQEELGGNHDPFADARMGGAFSRKDIQLASSYPTSIEFTHNGDPVVMSGAGLPIAIPRPQKS